MTFSLILTLSAGIDDLLVYRIASGVCLGGIFMQNSKVIAYDSRKIMTHKKNYLTHEYMLAVVAFALEIWCQYLYGMHVDVF